MDDKALIIGHIDHGKTTLSKVIEKSLDDKYLGAVSGDNADSEDVSRLIEMFTNPKRYDEFINLPLSSFVTLEPVRTTPKFGRNSICECGSGLKYKKCCLNK